MVQKTIVTFMKGIFEKVVRQKPEQRDRTTVSGAPLLPRIGRPDNDREEEEERLRKELEESAQRNHQQLHQQIILRQLHERIEAQRAVPLAGLAITAAAVIVKTVLPPSPPPKKLYWNRSERSEELSKESSGGLYWNRSSKGPDRSR